MVTVNGYTAERMAEIEANSVIDGEVVGDDLILTKFNGTTINAGHVKGDPGPVELNDWLNRADPPGTPKPYMGGIVPAYHGFCDAAVEYDADDYPALAAMFLTGPSCVNGACTVGFFRLPNLKGKILVGRDPAVPALDTLHETGGSHDAVVVSHDHVAVQDPHDHPAAQVPHQHGIAADGAHGHGIDGDDPSSDRIAFTHSSTHATATVGGAGDAQELSYGHLDGNGFHGHGDATGMEQPTVIITADGKPIDIHHEGVSGTMANMPPYRVINWIMRLA